MKTNTLLWALFILAPTFVVFGAESNPRAVERSIELALYTGDPARQTEAEEAVTQALAAAPKSAEWRYLDGFAIYARTAQGYRAGDMKAVQAALEAAEKALRAVKGAPWEGEAMALRGMISGQLISVRGAASAMTLGPKMNQLTSDAFESLPGSPRVKVCHAIMYLNTPAMFGGDKQEAMRLFQAAVQGFEAESRAKEGPQWGHALALGWLAQAKLQQGDLAGARQAAERALGVEPQYGWPRRILGAVARKEAGVAGSK